MDSEKKTLKSHSYHIYRTPKLNCEKRIIFHHKIQANTQKNQMQIFGDIQPARKEQKKNS